MRKASWTAAIKRGHTLSGVPARTSAIISRVPFARPWRVSSCCQSVSMHTGQRPAARHCCKGVEFLIAPGFFSNTSK
jgi:hypothetical protein